MLRFHSPGIPRSSQPPNILAGLSRVSEYGLDGIEIQFVQGVRMNPELTNKVRAKAQELNLSLTVHGPYWINFNSKEQEKIEKSKQYLIASLTKAYELGAKSVTFHAAYMHDDSVDEVTTVVVKGLQEVLTRLDDKVLENVQLAPELTGKPSQFGDLNQLCAVAKELGSNTSVCIDFTHYYARTGGRQNGYDLFKQSLQTISKHLGKDKLKQMHLHFGGMLFGDKGELKHQTLAKEHTFKWQELLKALKDRHVSGWVSVETPDIEISARQAQRYYQSL